MKKLLLLSLLTFPFAVQCMNDSLNNLIKNMGNQTYDKITKCDIEYLKTLSQKIMAGEDIDKNDINKILKLAKNTAMVVSQTEVDQKYDTYITIKNETEYVIAYLYDKKKITLNCPSPQYRP